MNVIARVGLEDDLIHPESTPAFFVDGLKFNRVEKSGLEFSVLPVDSTVDDVYKCELDKDFWLLFEFYADNDDGCMLTVYSATWDDHIIVSEFKHDPKSNLHARDLSKYVKVAMREVSVQREMLEFIRTSRTFKLGELEFKPIYDESSEYNCVSKRDLSIQFKLFNSFGMEILFDRKDGNESHYRIPNGSLKAMFAKAKALIDKYRFGAKDELFDYGLEIQENVDHRDGHSMNVTNELTEEGQKKFMVDLKALLKRYNFKVKQ